MVTKHFLYGVPGVGKTSIAHDIARRHLLLCLELDFLRSQAQETAKKEEEPFIFEYSTEAWKRFGELNKENSFKGFLAVREAFQKYIYQELTSHSIGYVAEAVYIDPNMQLDSKSAITLVVTRNKELHYSHFFVHRKQSIEEDKQFKVARYVQEYLIDEAEKLGIKILENNQVDPTMSR